MTAAAHAEGGRRCNWPSTQLYITAAGGPLPCCMVATADRASFGKVGPDGLLACWHGEPAQGLRAALAIDAPPDVCRHCALYHGTF